MNMKQEPHPITFDEIGKLQVDERNQLYWEGKPVKTEERIKLNWAVNLSVILTGISTSAIAIIEILNYLNK